MLRALQIFATLDEAWDSFKCGDYEAGAEVCGHIVGIDARRSFHDNTLHVPLSQPSIVDSNFTCPVPPTTKVDRGTSSFSLRLVQVGK